MSLRELRCRFTQEVAELIKQAQALGYECSLGEVLRMPEMAKIYAERGSGTRNSLHIMGLAVDLNLYRDGQWLKNTEDHLALGEWWEKRSKDHRWGGRFRRPDGNHYSITPDGERA